MKTAAYNSLRRLTPPALHKSLDRLEKSALARRLAGGVFWSASGAVVSRALALLTSIVTARMLGREVFGELGMLANTALMFTNLASFGMGLTATKYVAEFRLKDPVHAGRIIGVSSAFAWVSGSAMAVLVVAFAPWIAEHTLAAPHLAELLRISTLYLVLIVVNGAQLGVLSGFEAFKRQSLIQCIGGILACPITIAAVYWGGLIGAVWALVVTMGLMVFLNFQGIRREARGSGVPIRWTLSRQEVSVLWRFSLPAFLGSLTYAPAMWVANTIIVHQANGYSEMGMFSAADRWRTAILFLPMQLGSVALPILANLRNSDTGKYYRTLWSSVGLSSVSAVMIAVPVALLAPWIMGWYGPKFVSGSTVLVILCAVSFMTAASWSIGQSIVSQGRMWFMLVLNTTWAAILIGCCYLFRSHGALGLALAYLSAEGVRLLIVLGQLLTRQLRAKAEAASKADALVARTSAETV